MLREKNEVIYGRGFAVLVLDYEWSDSVSCPCAGRWVVL